MVNTPSETPTFATWSSEELVKFAIESYAKLQHQHEQIEALQRDLKTVHEAYREMIRRSDDFK